MTFSQCSSTCVLAGCWLSRSASEVQRMHKVECIIESAGDAIEGALPDPLSTQPVVFNELSDRALVGQRVVDEVLLRPGRDYQQRQTRAIAATALCMQRSRVYTGQSSIAGSACARAGEHVGGGGRLVH